MAKKASEKPPSSKPHATSAVPEKLGGGEVRLYSLKESSLPDVPNPPSERDLAECDWWVVHFPSRTIKAAGSRPNGLAALKAITRAEDKLGVVPPVKVKKAKKPSGKGKASTASKPDDQGKASRPGDPVMLTQVPADLDFDRAMKLAFPNQRIINEIELQLRATDDVYDREGNVVGSKPAWSARNNALKLTIEQAQGRAGEKQPPPPEKKKITYDELKQMILGSEATRKVLLNLIVEADEAAKQPKTPEGGG